MEGIEGAGDQIWNGGGFLPAVAVLEAANDADKCWSLGPWRPVDSA